MLTCALKYGGEGIVTVMLPEPDALALSALYAVTVQVTVPEPEVPTVIEPLVPEPEPEPAPPQDTDARVALLVAHEKVPDEPLTTDELENRADVTLGAGNGFA